MQIAKMRNENGGITLYSTIKIKSIKREYYEQLYANKLDNLDEKDKFLETHKLPKLILEKNRNSQQTFYK